MYLPANTKSYEHSKDMLHGSVSYVPLILFSALRFCTTITLLVWIITRPIIFNEFRVKCQNCGLSF